MERITLKEYAERKNITYEAVRQQVVRYRDDLEGHITKEGRQQFLDEEAVAFLNERRLKNPIAIFYQNKDDAIKDLEERVKLLLAKIADQADKISELSEWKSKHALLIASAEQTQRALEASTAAQRALEVSRDKYAQDAREAAQRAQKAIEEVRDLQEALEAAKQREAAQRARCEALLSRGFWDRLLNRDRPRGRRQK